MKIEHIALWVKNLESMKEFYCTHFGFEAGEKYQNKAKGFSSYFLSQTDGPRIELMHRNDIPVVFGERGEKMGLAHFALSLGSTQEVDRMTANFEQSGISVLGQPRWTGDGYYESVIEDPEGNWIELTV
ncbi:VOC family protein [Algoriphagus hitonicola]|uniref:Lactoylglutathione lyase n=1 Tax=Algoriphagus hitonicola TaxID=435880 RepID=A0A1I2QFM0_9BACT|nr:VOC family protein [Algoriphagus hitonicola]SFG26139.1 lactoylglutathione lyase [Algoriphagus hitonicola]